MDDVSGMIAAPAVGGKEAVFQVDQADLVWDAGIIGGAANLSGAVGGYFRVDLNGSIPFGTQGVTIALWINPISSNQDYEGVLMTRSTFIPSGDSGPTGDGTGSGVGMSNLGLAWRGANRIDSRWNSAVNSDPETAEGLVSEDDSVGVLGGWYHLVLVWDGVNGTHTQYINGVQTGTTSAPTGTLQTGGIWALGADPNDSFGETREFNGLIDDVAVWDEIVSPADIVELFNRTKSPADINPLDDPDGDLLSSPYEEMFPGFLDPMIPDADQDVDRIGGLLAGAEMPDGLTNAQEHFYGTDPSNPDTDDDGISDSDEINGLGTDPLNPDSDGDNLTDGAEVAGSGGFGPTDPLRVDSDRDTINDDVELSSDPPSDPNDPDDPNILPPLPVQVPVALYRFDETDGATVAADSAVGDGAQDLTQIAGAVGWTNGIIGNAVNLTEDVMSGVDAITNGATELTISAWINEAPGQGGYRGIYTTGAPEDPGGVDNWGLNVEAGRQGDLRVNNDNEGSSFGIDTPETANQGEWNLLTLTYTGDGVSATAKGYLNGILINTVSDAQGMERSYSAGEQTWYLGRDRTSDNRRFTGLVDDLAIWDVALSDEDVMGIYLNGLRGTGIPVPEGVDFVITEIVRNADGSVDLTWNSDPAPGTTYTILLNEDFTRPIAEWRDVDDGVQTMGEKTSYQVLADDLAGIGRAFFVVVLNGLPE
ncbi:MAG: LamG-like jellyroll fold domain-containing protein [Verrucomicrobiales bacterium]